VIDQAGGWTPDGRLLSQALGARPGQWTLEAKYPHAGQTTDANRDIFVYFRGGPNKHRG
jgi:hypothetical protein